MPPRYLVAKLQYSHKMGLSTPDCNERDRGAQLADYPMSRGIVVYGGTRAYREAEVDFIPVETFVRELPERL